MTLATQRLEAGSAMNLLIFGATGGTGRALVEQALDRGRL